MKKAIWVGLLLALVFAAPSFADDHWIKVQLEVSAPETHRYLITSKLKRELRKLGDVKIYEKGELASSDFRFILDITAGPIEFGEVLTGLTLSFIVLIDDETSPYPMYLGKGMNVIKPSSLDYWAEDTIAFIDTEFLEQIARD